MDKKMILSHNVANNNRISFLNIQPGQRPGGKDIVFLSDLNIFYENINL